MHDSSFGRVFAVLFAPAKTFESIAARPTWLVPLLLFSLLGLGSSFVIGSKVDFREVIVEQIESSPAAGNLTEEQKEKQIDFAERLSTAVLYGAPTVGPWIVYPIVAGIFWLLFKLLGSGIDFKRSLAVVTHGVMPFAVSAVLTVPVVMGQEAIDLEALQSGTLLASNAGAFLPADASATLRALATSLDLFSLWTIALLIIGYRVVAKASRASAAAVVIGPWLLWVLAKVGLANLGQAFGG